jgi:tRNA pseudouridine55 synthase
LESGRIETKSGFLLVNKPVGPSSHDIIDQLRKVTGIKKIGHAGTLDPLASGLLIIGVGSSTKQLQNFVGLPKAYRAVVRLGITSTTDDREGELTRVSDDRPTKQDVELILDRFRGESEQLPPAYSAVKVGGVKGYEAARRGHPLELKPRKVNISSLQLISYNYPDLALDCDVSSGTYIRSLARDIGTALGSGGYLHELERISIGEYSISEALEPTKITQDNWTQKLFKVKQLEARL